MRGWQPDTSYVKHGFADPIYPEVLLDQCVLEGSCAERREAKPSRHQTERLAKVTSIEKHYAVGARLLIFPHGPRKYRSH